jgi:hypothetical protein
MALLKNFLLIHNIKLTIVVAVKSFGSLKIQEYLPVIII